MLVSALAGHGRMSVGVVIPCRNEEARILEVLDALASQDLQADDVVVVDDGSTDATAAVITEWCRQHPGQPVRTIAGAGRGIPAAVNAGIAALATDIVARLDGHCRPAVDYLQRAVRLAEQADVGVAGGTWVIEPGAATLEAAAIAIAVGHPFGSGGAAYRQGQPGHSDATPTSVRLRQGSGETSPKVEERRRVRSALRTESPESTSSDVDTVPFGCFRRALWVELGGMDEQLGANEDYEFNYRVRQRGLRVVLDPAIRCTYYARPTIGAVAQQYGRYGWWKARMLANHPASLRSRQLIAALVAPGLATVLLGVVFFGGAVWPLLLALYPLIVVAGAIHAAATRGRWAATAWLAGVFATIQVSWSAGFWCSLVSAVVSRLVRTA
jgi:succinoglycan biosynthesis protein ExoA